MLTLENIKNEILITFNNFCRLDTEVTYPIKNAIREMKSNIKKPVYEREDSINGYKRRIEREFEILNTISNIIVPYRNAYFDAMDEIQEMITKQNKSEGFYL